MTSTKSDCAISGLVLLLFCVTQFASKADNPLFKPHQVLGLSVEYEPSEATNQVLRLRLTNTGTNTVAIPLGHLPWDLYAMTLVLVEADDPFSMQLKQQVGIGDPLPGKPHQLKSGQTLEGRIQLNRRYPGLTDKLRRADILVFWAYECPAEGVFMNRLGGWLAIPRIKAPN